MSKTSEDVKATQDPELNPEAGVDSSADKNADNSSENSSEPTNQEEAPSEMDQLRAEVEDLKNQNLRLYAEFDNFRKRTNNERLELSKTANREVVAAMLPVLDDFQRALKNLGENDTNAEAVKGIELIYNKLRETLKQKGLVQMESTVGKKFDVDVMEAITKIPAPQPDMAGTVIDEIEAGYTLGNTILRYAKVVVADGEPQS